MFGAGAKEMGKFFERLEKLWIGKVAIPSVIGETEIGPVMITGPSELDLWTRIYTPEVVAELGGYLDRASKLAGADPMASKRIAWIRAGFYGTLLESSSAFMKDISVERELSRRASSAATNVLDGIGFSLPKGCSRDKTTCITPSGSVKVVAAGNLYVGVPLSGRLRPNTRYRLSYFIRLDGLRSGKGWGGACAEYEEYAPEYRAVRTPSGKCWQGTREWLHQSGEFTTGPLADQPQCRPHFWLRVFNSTGTVWFDGMRIEECAR